MTDLKPCPFCGGEAELHDYRLCWSVQCVNCDASVVGDRVDELESEADEQSVDWDAIKQTAITAWNTRTDTIPRWHTDMDAAKNEGTVIIECYVDFKRVVSTGGWDSHWSFEGWVYDNKRIPQGTIPVRWQPLPAPPKETTK